MKQKNGTRGEFEQTLLAGLRHAVAIVDGEREPARVTMRTMKKAGAEVLTPPAFTRERVQHLRATMAISQPVFAEVLNVSLATVRGWERGARVPDGPSLRLLELAERHPAMVMETVGIARNGRTSATPRRSATKHR